MKLGKYSETQLFSFINWKYVSDLSTMGCIITMSDATKIFLLSLSQAIFVSSKKRFVQKLPGCPSYSGCFFKIFRIVATKPRVSQTLFLHVIISRSISESFS